MNATVHKGRVPNNFDIKNIFGAIQELRKAYCNAAVSILQQNT